MTRHARSCLFAAATASALLAGISAGVVTATTPPDGDPLFVIEVTPDATDVDATTEITAEPVIRATPYVVAQGLIELDAGRAWQWQVHDFGVSPAGGPLNATANLFLFSDRTLALASHSSPVASVLGGPDEVIALPIGSEWTLRALGADPAPATLFGVGHADGGTAPVGTPFTVDSGGWYQLEVRAYQLLPGEIAEFGDGSSSTLLFVRSGTVGTPVGELGAGERATGDRGELINAGDEPADVLAAAVIAIPADLAAVLITGPSPGPASTSPPATSAPSATSAPTTTEAPRAPTANNDSASSTGGEPASVNILGNDDRGNPPAEIVDVNHSGIPITIGVPFDTGNGTVVLQANGTVTLTVANVAPGGSINYSIFYTLQNAHGSSQAMVQFEVEG